MQLLEQYIDEAFERQDENDTVRTRFIGDVSALSETLKEKIARIEQMSQGRTGMTVNVAFNYGGRDELVRAARQLAIQAQQGKLDPQQINEQMLSDHLYTSGQPDPDLMIWQAAYSEFVFMDVLWPDFTPAHLDQALEIFSHRNRRYGQV